MKTMLVLAVLAAAAAAGQLAADEAVVPSSPVEAPTLIRSVSPEFPLEDALRPTEHRFVVRARIDARGHVVAAGVVASDAPHLNAALLESLRKWEFQPAQRDGVATHATVEFPVRVMAAGQALARN